LAAGVALALVVVVVLGSVRFGVARSRLPERGSRIEILDGCPGSTEIRFDGRGVPHISTDDEEALWFAQGYVHARDRFFQMEVARRMASGRLAEILGAGALTSDRRMRTWRLGASARRQAALLDGRSREVLDAYAAGVNAALDRFGARISPEIWLIGIEPEPWSATSSLEVALLLQLDLSWSMGEEFKRAVELTELGRDRAVELWGWLPSEAREWIPPGDLAVGPRGAEEPIRSPISGAGSNSWALSPEKTATGRSILAADPHLGVHLPGPFALIHLKGPGIHVAGASLPGTPGVLIGHNEHVAWSFTAAMLDDQDLFLLTLDEEGENELVDGTWLRVRTVTEEIRVRWQLDPVLLKVRMSEHGPLVRDNGSQAMALSWTGLEGSGTVRSILALNQAVSAGDAALAWDGVIGPSLNLVAADTSGQILHQVVGLAPDRGQGAGRLPAPGADSRWAWRGFLPMARNPRTLDPEDGFLATANHDFYAEGEYPMRWSLPGDFASPWRVRRIRRMLAAREDWSVPATLQLQRDVVSERAIAMLKLIREDLTAQGGPNAQSLLEWDGRMVGDEIAPHVFARFVLELGVAVGADEMAGRFGSERLMRLLAGGMSDAWWDDTATPETETRTDLIVRVLDRLDREPVTATWGEAHQILFRHPLTRIPVAGRLLAGSWNRGPFPSGGDNVTINATYWSERQPFAVSVMPALRMVTDVGSWDESIVVMPLGQSGRPWSSHYADQTAAWRQGGAFTLAFSEAAVERATEARLVLRPRE
jgi:penicillin amidase